MGKDIYGGIEGGATKSTCVLVNACGKVIAEGTGSGTNHFLTGMDECRKRIADLVNSLKKEIGMNEDVPLKSLGLSLSGCEKEDTNQVLAKGLAETYPNLSELYAIGSDTEGPVAATSSNGGIICIAGTGSNTLLINPDGTKYQCGGWGYMLGDEGSAWNMALKATKYCFNHFDGFEEPPYSIDNIWNAMKQYFQAETFLDLLDVYYANFDKAFIAAFCKQIAEEATKGDKLSMHIFDQSGLYLARSLSAVILKASKELTDRKGGIHILCIGSVWKSWDLLKSSFVSHIENNTKIEELSLMKIKITAAVGSVYMAVDKYNIHLPRDYTKNYDVFYTYKREGRKSCKNTPKTDKS